MRRKNYDYESYEIQNKLENNFEWKILSVLVVWAEN